MRTTLRARIQSWAASRGWTLFKGRNRGETVWVILTPEHTSGHRYTLTSGTACHAWNYTLADLARTIGLERKDS